MGAPVGDLDSANSWHCYLFWNRSTEGWNSARQPERQAAENDFDTCHSV